MSEISDRFRAGRLARLQDFLAQRRGMLKDYLSAISGSGGRLVFSLIYFIALANALSIADFGLFATASAAGVMLSRILGLRLRFVGLPHRHGPAAPDRRVHRRLPAAGGCCRCRCWRPRHGRHSPSSLPAPCRPRAFAIVIVAEALLWRPAELVIIVNNGMGRFGRAAMLAIIGTAIRAAAAVAFVAMPAGGLAGWTLALSRRQRRVADRGRRCSSIRARGCVLKTGLYFKRLPDALYVAGAEVLFYLQMELDKLLVLALGGAAARRHLRHHHAAGRPDRDPDPRLHDDAGAKDDAGAGNAGAAAASAPASRAASSPYRRWRCCAWRSCCISSRVRSAATSPKPRRWSCWRSSCRDCAIWWNTRPSCCSAAARC